MSTQEPHWESRSEVVPLFVYKRRQNTSIRSAGPRLLHLVERCSLVGYVAAGGLSDIAEAAIIVCRITGQLHECVFKERQQKTCLDRPGIHMTCQERMGGFCHQAWAGMINLNLIRCSDY